MAAASYVTQLIFFIFMLFILGGILVVYREDRKLTTAEFFENCGLYFWRFVRLTLLSLIPFGICFGSTKASSRQLADHISEISAYESYPFWTRAIGGFIVILLFLWVRLWFDVAQVRAVAQNERRMVPQRSPRLPYHLGRSRDRCFGCTSASAYWHGLL